MKDSIKTKLLLWILIPMVATMVILTGVSLKMASSIIEETTNDEMTAQLDYQESKVQEIVTEIETKANDLSRDISLQYKKLTPADMENSIIAMTDSGDMVLGSGLWFEPNVYIPGQKYFGPYAMKSNGKISITYDYSNADYDYLNNGTYQRNLRHYLRIDHCPYRK